MIAGVVELSDHMIPDDWLEVSVTLPPLQKVTGPPAEIVGVVGVGFTVTAIAFDTAEQPLGLVTVTLYVPLVVTLMVCVVALLLQRKVAPG